MNQTEELRRDLVSGVSKVELKEYIDDEIIRLLKKIGIYYRCFSRQKEPESIIEKIKRKGYSDERKMQDLYGIRIVLYYCDDTEIVVNQLKEKFECLEIVRDEREIDEFKPERLNMVCRFPKTIIECISDVFLKKFFIDTTFEIQIRTVFSEGWHEVEHDMRYKCKESWKDYEEYSRIFNGIFATLCTCDWAIVHLFDKMAYENYKNKQWDYMIKNKFRLKVRDSSLSESIKRKIDENHELAKAIYRYDRKELIDFFCKSKINIPITNDNIVKIINYYTNLDEKLKKETFFCENLS